MKKLLLVLALAAVLFAGCGGGDDGGSVDTSEDAADRSSGGSSGDDTEFSGEGGDDFCELAKQYDEDFKDIGESTNPEDREREFEELNDAIDKLASEAPSEIRADVNTVAEAVNQYTDLLAKYDYDFSRVPEEEAAEIDFASDAVEGASNRVESYFEKVCKIDSDGDGDTDGVIDDGSTDDAPTDEQAPADETEETTGE